MVFWQLIVIWDQISNSTSNNKDNTSRFGFAIQVLHSDIGKF